MYLAPAAVQEQIAASLNMGLRSSGGAVARCSLGVLQQLAAQHLQQQSNAGFNEIVKHYLTFVFDWFVLQSFDMDLLELAAESLFTLLCCNMAQFQALAKQLIESQVRPRVLVVAPACSCWCSVGQGKKGCACSCYFCTCSLRRTPSG